MTTYFSSCTPIVLNCHLFYDPELTIPVNNGFYSDGTNCFEVTGFLGEITAITPCAIPCNLAFTGITTTDPTSVGGTDGTITANFTTVHGPSTYTLNGVDQGAAVSPLVITGLSGATPYTIVITDSNACTATTTVTLGISATLFDADWIMVTYEFVDGLDLDTRSRIAVPDIGQNTQPEYLGWDVLEAFPATGIPIVKWGDDNVGTGFESILINIPRFKQLFPAETEFIVDLRCFWFDEVGVIPVVAGVTLWKGGLPVEDGCGGYCWTNPTATATGTIDSVPKVITLNTTDGNTSGERLATLKYNLNTFIAVLNNADVTTPSV